MKTKKEHIALFIGRFQPIHKGHVQVIQKILQKHDKVKIAIGSAQKHHEPKNPFTKEERKKMLVAALQEANISPKKYNIYFVPDIPNDNAYPAHVRKIVGMFEKVFTGYWLNIKLFRKAGYVVHAIQRIPPFSATTIRKSVRKNTKQYKKHMTVATCKIMGKLDGKKRIKETKKSGQGGI